MIFLLLQKDCFSFQFMEINENPVLLKLSPLQSSASEVKTLYAREISAICHARLF